ncbi:MAG: nucleoside triphosphate pyrophosphohydrolase [Raoultibacter sp.]
MKEQSVSAHPAFDEFVSTIAALRAPDGCPWDREQTHESIASNMLEEAYEAVDAIEQGDVAHLREELGDVLLQIVLQAQIAQDAGEFTIDDVIDDINAKMIRRHPHVFGEAQASSAQEVSAIWDAVKLTEQEEGLLDSVPVGFPALMQASKISRKVVSVGFEWETLNEVWEQVYSEIEELKHAYDQAPKDEKGRVLEKHEVELEMGDVLFTLVNVSRKMGVDAETALRATCRKFKNRWAFIEGAAWAQGKRAENLSVEEMEELWAQAKTLE